MRPVIRLLYIQFSLLAMSQSLVHAQAPNCANPNVLLIMDHSGSMEGDPWDQATTAIEGVSLAFETRLRFGMMFFPTGPTFDCEVEFNQTVLSDVAPMNGASIRNAMNALPDPEGSTPLAQALRTGVQYYQQLNDLNRNNILVLITDGDERCERRRSAVSVASDAAAQGYPVYVIGFGAGIGSPDILNEIAEAGGTDRYYPAMGADGLFQALSEIANQASAEICDGLDNDCDGNVDEGIAARPCDDGCGIGEITCIDGVESECAGGAIPIETCDGRDNDCDELIDEQVLVDCTTPEGTPGTALCMPGGVPAEECNSSVPDEICDGQDNDMDGRIDEGTNVSCNVECHEGRRLCIEGVLRSCSAAPVTIELCNGVDDDCDDRIDEMAECAGFEICGTEGLCLQPCDNGECFPGTTCQEDDFCHPLPCEPSCAAHERCIEQECIIPCTFDEQCLEYGMICRSEERRCIPGMSMPNDMTNSGSSNQNMNGMSSNNEGETNSSSIDPDNSFAPPPVEPEMVDPAETVQSAACASSKVDMPLLFLICFTLGLVIRRIASNTAID